MHAKNNPRQFRKPSIQSALAAAMATPLSIAIRVPIAGTVASCVGAKDIQAMVSCPISVGEELDGTVVRFNRKKYGELCTWIA